MRAVRKVEPRPGVRVEIVDPPAAVAPGDVIVQVEAAGICGSDLHVFDWWPGYDWIRHRLPVTLGHEFAGRAVEVAPGVGGVRVGDRVAIMPSIGCGRCAACRDGRPEDCDAKVSLGFTRDGGFADYAVVPEANCLRMPDHVDSEVAALTEPLCVAVRALRIGEVAAGDRVLVMGPGTIGQAIALMALKAGAAEVILVGRDDADRLRNARDLGIEHTADVAFQSLGDAVGGKVDRVFEATGVPTSIDAGLSVLRREGIFVAAGIHPGPASIDITRLVREKHQLRGTINHSAVDWTATVALISECGEDFRPMITHRIALGEGEAAFELAHSRVASKVILVPAEG